MEYRNAASANADFSKQNFADPGAFTRSGGGVGSNPRYWQQAGTLEGEMMSGGYGGGGGGLGGGISADTSPTTAMASIRLLRRLRSSARISVMPRAVFRSDRTWIRSTS